MFGSYLCFGTFPINKGRKQPVSALHIIPFLFYYKVALILCQLRNECAGDANLFYLHPPMSAGCLRGVPGTEKELGYLTLAAVAKWMHVCIRLARCPRE